jgi:S1-C subfamily serine protease
VSYHVVTLEPGVENSSELVNTKGEIVRMNKQSILCAVMLTVLMAITTVAQEVPSQPVVTQPATQIQVAAGNQEVFDLLKAGMSPAVIVAKIKVTQSKFDTSPTALNALKVGGATDEIILAVIEVSAAKKEVATGSASKRRVTDELTTRFKELQLSVVTVWSEIGQGTGFIFDERGLVMTNQHVIGPSEIVSVQFDQKIRVPARILAVDPQKDVAVLWIDIASLQNARVAKIAKGTEEEPAVIEGERVMTIGSPLNQRKIMTTGIASKVEPRAIISDININHGNSGGPLFNSIGEVIGITTFGDLSTQGGPGISGIVRIEETTAVVDLATGKMSLIERPDARLLPVDPTDKYPLDAIKDVVEAKKFDFKPYFFNEADFQVTLMTPPMTYRAESEAKREAEKTKNKRTKSKDALQSTPTATDQFYNWREYVGDYKPILIINAQPVLAESFWGAVGRGVAANYGIHTQANLRFKTDFYRMKLFCGDKEVAPIHPAKVYRLTNERSYFIKSNDATYAGAYSYPANAINESCGVVRLELFSEKHPDKAESKTLDKKTVERIILDFGPYFRTKQ